MVNVKEQKDNLVKWCAVQVQDYDVEVKNLTTSWKSGLALCAILHHYDPESIQFDSLNEDEAEKNVELALKVAKERWGIYPLIDAEDLLIARPDSKQMYTYLAEYYKRLQTEIPKGGKTSKLLEASQESAANESQVSEGTTASKSTKPTPTPEKKLTKKKRKVDISEAGFKKAMDHAMNAMSRQKKTAELLRAKREGRLVEFLYPELEKRGYNREILTKLGVETSQEDSTSDEGSVQKPVKQCGEKENIKKIEKKIVEEADSKTIGSFKGDCSGISLNKDKLAQFADNLQRAEKKPQIAEVNIPSHEGFAKTYDQGQAPSFWENLFIMCYCSQFDEDDFYLELDDLDTC